MPVWLITGLVLLTRFFLIALIWTLCSASRGIGLELVKNLATNPDNAVLATCRTPAEATELRALADASEDLIHVIQLDQENVDSIKQAAETAEELLGELPVDYIINNAAFVSSCLLS